MASEKELQELGEFWRFQSGQMWSRIQTASFVEAGVLTGWYTVYKDQAFSLGMIILSAGSVLLLIIGLLMRRDSQYMEICEKKLGQYFIKPGKPFLRISGRIIAVSIPVGLAIINIVLLVFQKIF